MENQTKTAPDAATVHLAAIRCARASLLVASLRRPRAPTAPAPQDRRSSSSISSSAAAECAQLRSKGLVAAARHEVSGHARIAGSELLLVLAVAALVLLLLLLLGLL